jgi:hypothetical protein
MCVVALAVGAGLAGSSGVGATAPAGFSADPSSSDGPSATPFATPSAAPAAGPPSHVGAPWQNFLGFRLEEERRYALGPADALVEGEAAEWGIKLHHIEVDTASPLAVFDLDYTRREPFGPLRESRVTRSLWAELTVNSHGFPLKVVVGERVESGEIITDYVYSDGRYEATTRWPETELSVTLRIPGFDADDGPRGVYAFLTQIADRRFDGGKAFTDSVFANPGLLSLAMPRPLPIDDVDEDLTFLTPGVRLVRFPTQEWIRMQRNPQVLRSHFDRNRLELRGVEEIEIGEETVLARRFEIQGPFRNGYVDALGRVLLLEHDPGSGMERPQHIRMLGPSEY